jgi:hypothetical protein
MPSFSGPTLIGFFTLLFSHWEDLFMKRFFANALPALAAMLLFAGVAQASVITVGYYRLGEADPGAVAGNPVNATTEDSSGLGNAVNLVGPLTYSSDVAPSAAAATGSSLSMSNPGGYGYIGSPWTTAVDNFGMEGWFKLSNVVKEQALVWNGNAAAGNGWGLLFNGGYIQGYFAGVSIWNSDFAPTQDEWFYAAIVRDAGVARVYINGTTPATATSTITPTTPAGLAALCTAGGDDGMLGLMDEVRVFTFEPGSFNASTDLLISVPEPSTFALLAMSILGIAAFARRKR